MATQKTKTEKPKAPREKTKAAAESQADLDKSPSRKAPRPKVKEVDQPINLPDDVVENINRPERAEKPVRKGPIQDAVTDFLANTKSNDDAIRQTKKSEYFATINKKAWDRLLEQKDSLGQGLFRMRLGNMLRGSISKAAKLEEKAKHKAEKQQAKKAA